MENIPLPEHPRPDFERPDWMNLNGHWAFTFDDAAAAAAVKENDFSKFDKQILVPFPWGSKLSEVEDDGVIGWYARSVMIPRQWQGKRIFLVVGAADWETRAWFDGRELGTHQGGYTPFEFELTRIVRFGSTQWIALRIDDAKNDAHLYGKQGYGNACGIWQTVYLEARGENFIRHIHFTPDIDKSRVQVELALGGWPKEQTEFRLTFKSGGQQTFTRPLSDTGPLFGSETVKFDISLDRQHLWTIEDPFLYEVNAAITVKGRVIDEVDTYFGQRKIGVVRLPGTDFPYIALNDKPVYLQAALDQSYHPDGFYTFPTDEFIKNEIMISKKLGLNGNRIHIKVEVPRKLYWADRLGLLIMADRPNFWGEPTEAARKDWEHCMREQVRRDYNHPAIFSWVNFNETWGLLSKKADGKGREYTEETQEWARAMYRLAKSLDPSRLVEDNSPNKGDHVETDINSWHGYFPGYLWPEIIAMYDRKTSEGSEFNYIGGNRHNGAVPMMNSECGNVWGYEGSAGDVDYTWDYHIMMNAFRMHPKICGWVYTEHHDVINEWNGYVKYDRSPKFDGLGDLVPGMTMADFHSRYYVAPMRELCADVAGGRKLSIPFHASFMTDENPGRLTLTSQLVGWNQLGERKEFGGTSMEIAFEPYMSREAGKVDVTIPMEKGLYLLQCILGNDRNEVLHRNFVAFVVKDGQDMEEAGIRRVTFAPASFTAQAWSIKQSGVLNRLKMNGFGSGYFEYAITWPAGCKVADLASASLVFEASAKQLFGKDATDSAKIEGDFMLGGGTHDPCKNPNAYAMTDTRIWPSKVNVSVNGRDAGSYPLEDDPADHRGILSWHAQPKDGHFHEVWGLPKARGGHLHEAGSYGYLVKADIPLDALDEGQPIVIRLTVPEDVGNGQGGLALYGKDFGRYPLDPTIVFKEK